MFLGCAGEVGTPCRGCAACPQQLLACLDVRREELVLEIAGFHANATDHEVHALRFGNIARERLLTRDALQLTAAAMNRIDDLLDVLDARMVRAAQPDRVDVLVHHHFGDGCVGLRRTYVEFARQAGRRRSVRRMGTPYSDDVGIANAAPGLQVKTGVEATADERDAEALGSHELWDCRSSELPRSQVCNRRSAFGNQYSGDSLHLDSAGSLLCYVVRLGFPAQAARGVAPSSRSWRVVDARVPLFRHLDPRE